MSPPHSMPAPATGPEAEERALVQRFWALYQARRWGEARELLHPQACCQWWATAERFVGAAAVVHVNEIYPEGWSLHLLALHSLAPGQVLSLLRVDQDGRSFYANSYFQLKGGRITALDEYWSDVQAPPAWRQSGLPGRELLPPDRRQGLSLALPEG
ncbi:hypothetical protein [Roseateles sp.]|uniref:hypothetical protein n=1 Tax=Roseateles sp. TaxID=1971397 RepID=UPI0039197C6B